MTFLHVLKKWKEEREILKNQGIFKNSKQVYEVIHQINKKVLLVLPRIKIFLIH